MIALLFKLAWRPFLMQRFFRNKISLKHRQRFTLDSGFSPGLKLGRISIEKSQSGEMKSEDGDVTRDDFERKICVI